MEVPRLEKVTLNMGVGEAKQTASVLEAATEQLATIAGQRPNVRRARKSIASFKIREGMPVGRGRDAARRPDVGVRRPPDLRSRFRASATSAGSTPARSTGGGTTPWASASSSSSPRSTTTRSTKSAGSTSTITTSAKTDEEAFELLLALGFPFSQEGRPGPGRPRDRGGGATPRGGSPARRGRGRRARAAQGGEPGGLRQARPPARRARKAKRARGERRGRRARGDR